MLVTASWEPSFCLPSLLPSLSHHDRGLSGGGAISDNSQENDAETDPNEELKTGEGNDETSGIRG